MLLTNPVRKKLALGVLGVILAGLAGCASALQTLGLAGSVLSPVGGSLSVRSQRPGGAELQGGFQTGFYAFDDVNHITIVLLDGPEETARQAVTIRMFWEPWAGKTPISATATNASVRLVIFSGRQEQEAGVYDGAGYVFPNTTPGGKELSAGLWDATLKLADCTAGFADLLGESTAKGKFTVRRDDAATQRILMRLSQRVSQSLQYPLLVKRPALPPRARPGSSGGPAPAMESTGHLRPAAPPANDRTAMGKATSWKRPATASL